MTIIREYTQNEDVSHICAILFKDVTDHTDRYLVDLRSTIARKDVSSPTPTLSIANIDPSLTIACRRFIETQSIRLTKGETFRERSYRCRRTPVRVTEVNSRRRYSLPPRVLREVCQEQKRCHRSRIFLVRAYRNPSNTGFLITLLRKEQQSRNAR